MNLGMDIAEDEIAIGITAEALVGKRRVGEDLEQHAGKRAGREGGLDDVGIVVGILATGEP